MPIKDTLAGLIVLGLLLAGVFSARGWRPWGDQAADVTSSPVKGPPEDATVPDVTIEDGIVQTGDVRITLSVSPRPPVAFEASLFRVRVESNGLVVPLERGQISFEMAMPMGDHRYALATAQDGWQKTQVVLPMCPSGSSRWHAIVEGNVSGRKTTAHFRLDLAPARPNTAPPAS